MVTNVSKKLFLLLPITSPIHLFRTWHLAYLSIAGSTCVPKKAETVTVNSQTINLFEQILRNLYWTSVAGPEISLYYGNWQDVCTSPSSREYNSIIFKDQADDSKSSLTLFCEKSCKFFISEVSNDTNPYYGHYFNNEYHGGVEHCSLKTGNKGNMRQWGFSATKTSEIYKSYQ